MTLPEVQQEKRKVPKRVIYFSDGVLEEYSTDEEAVEERKKVEALEEEKRKKESLVNPKTLAWWDIRGRRRNKFENKKASYRPVPKLSRCWDRTIAQH